MFTRGQRPYTSDRREALLAVESKEVPPLFSEMQPPQALEFNEVKKYDFQPPDSKIEQGFTEQFVKLNFAEDYR